MVIELNCPKCGNNRFTFPSKDHEPVSCDFCGEAIGTYAEVKDRIAAEVVRSKKRR
jgi:ribosomal protein S27E